MNKKQIKVGSKVWVENVSFPYSVIAIGETEYVVRGTAFTGSNFRAIKKDRVFATKAARNEWMRKDVSVGDYVMLVSRNEHHSGLVIKARRGHLSLLLDDELTNAYCFHKDRNGLVKCEKKNVVVLLKVKKGQGVFDGKEQVS